jgi:hypothetical protein
MSSPRGTYSGGYYSSPFFPDTPIYDSLVAERGTPQIAPIRVPSAYDSGSNLPALPAALPALPSGSSPSMSPSMPAQGMRPMPSAAGTPAQGTYTGYPSTGYPQPAPLQQAPAAYIPQQTGPRGPYNSNFPSQQAPAAPYQGPAGYEPVRPQAPRPVPPRQVPPGGYDEQPYQRRNLGLGVPPTQSGGGYYQG